MFSLTRQTHPASGAIVYRILETNWTSDGPRTRVCDGIWYVETDAMSSLQVREKQFNIEARMPDQMDKDAAFEILGMLCPLTRRDAWWHTDAPQALLEDFLAKYRSNRNG